MRTITRTQLLDVTENAIEAAVTPPALAAAVRQLAATVERVDGTWWVEREECGCLVGTLRKREGRKPTGDEDHPDFDAEDDLGMKFLWALMSQVGSPVVDVGFVVVDG